MHSTRTGKEIGSCYPTAEPMEFGTAKKEEKLTATECIGLNFYLNGLRFSDEFMLIPQLSEPAIIGAKTLQHGG
jgi:hypothetical protein